MTDPLDVARQLAADGIPIFAAYPDQDHEAGFRLPAKWQETTPNPAYVDAWKPGMALCMVTGCGLDVIDVDPRNGGEITSIPIPTVYAMADTPSGGRHFFIRSLGVHSRDAIAPGVDLKAGADDGKGRGFVFLAPTERKSKVTGEVEPYTWLQTPDHYNLGKDTSGADLAAYVDSVRSQRTEFGERVNYSTILQGVSEGERDDTLFRFAASLRSRGIAYDWAEQMVQEAAANCEPPFPADAAAIKVQSAYGRYPEGQPATVAPALNGMRFEDVWAYLPEHKYIYTPTRGLWPAASVDNSLGPVDKKTPASLWLDRHRPIHQMTWAPGEDTVLHGWLVSDGGWTEKEGISTFNLYRPPAILPGEYARATPWLEHVHYVYSVEAEHLLDWLAHRVQRPWEKTNHALVLGGEQGVGKDTLLEPVKHAVGPWNFSEVSPGQLLGRFNSFVKSVILRVSEGRDLGESDRYSFYEHMKSYTAAPPDVLRVDEKNAREYAVPNVMGVIITTNHKISGLYIPPDDRRHYVAWSDCTAGEFTSDYWTELYDWYQAGGLRHVAAYLAQRDLSGFDAKAPPPKTDAFWAVVDANRAPEDAEMSDCLEALGWPDVVTKANLMLYASPDFTEWLRDMRNSRKLNHRFDSIGYEPVRNPRAVDGRWKVGGKGVSIYARKDLTLQEQLDSAEKLSSQSEVRP